VKEKEMGKKSLKFSVATEREDFTVVEVEILRENGIALSEDVREVSNAPQVVPQRGVIISGRLPVWLFAALAHHYHPAAWVGIYDPRLGGGVVVQSHTPRRKLGEVVW
jgi:CRISPR-associated protein Csx3